MAKKEFNIHKELKLRKYKKCNPLYYFIYYAVGRTRLLGGKYHPHYKKSCKIEKGPGFVIFNHLSRRDHTFVTTLCWPRRINMVAGYNEFGRKHLYWVFKQAQILPKKIFENDFNGMRAMDKIIRQGGLVAFSPEGTSSLYGNNQPIVPGTGKYLKQYRLPVYYVELRGAYLTNNKISGFTDRIGEVYAELKLLFSKEDLERMSGDEIQDKINEVFTHDDYEWNKIMKIEYKSKDSMTTHLPDMCYRCPKCGELFSMKEKHDEIYCEKCGNGAKMDHFYNLIPYNKDCVIPDTPTKWTQWEREQVIKEVRDPKFSFEIECDLGYMPSDRLIPKETTSIKCGHGKIKVDHKGFHFNGTKLGEPFTLDLDYNQIFTCAISVDLTIVSLFLGDNYYDFGPLGNKGAYFLMCVEEMHRYHVNTWKNLKVFDYMYKGYKLGIDNK